MVCFAFVCLFTNKVPDGSLLMDVEIPANTTATVFVPAVNADAVKESGHDLSHVNTIKVKDTEDGYVVLELGSGTYHFAVQNVGK